MWFIFTILGRSVVSTGSTFLIHLPNQSLPAFSIGRGGISHLTLWGESPDIKIEGDVVFSQTFCLMGQNRDAITRLFDKAMVSFFRSHTLLFAAGILEVQPHAILFNHANQLDAEDIRSTLDTLSALIIRLSSDSEN